nr:putative esterase [uncultured bacterium]
MAESFLMRLKKRNLAAEAEQDKPSAFQQQLAKFKFEPDQINAFQDGFRRVTNQFDTPGPRMARTENFNVGEGETAVPCRLFIPFGADEVKGPCLVYFHGGGFVTCDVETHEGITRRLRQWRGLPRVVRRLSPAPQHPYPAGPDDCEAVLKWALEGHGIEGHGIDPENIAIGGDSAGGNMAAFLGQKYRHQLKSQILLYPLMQLMEFKPPKPGPQDWLQLGFMALKFIDEHYVAGADATDTRLSPLLESNLGAMPPTYVLTAGLDPLRDEGKLYADKLGRHGCEVTYHHEKSMPHGFLNFARAFPKAKSIPLDAADVIRRHFPRPHGFS